MKRFTLSAFSILLAVGAMAPTAQALPQVDADFKLQTLRLNEFDARNKSKVDADFKLQTLRLNEFDARNKSKVDADFKLQTLRLSEFDARNKSKVDADFKLQSLRLSEFDARNKSEDSQQPYYPQPSTQASPQNVTAEQDSLQTTEPTVWKAPKAQEEAPSPALSLTQRRHQSLDRS
ncbi:MAG: hypothetical protein AAFV90_18640 [Cyanobacteria bacterium J06634_5]